MRNRRPHRVACQVWQVPVAVISRACLTCRSRSRRSQPMEVAPAYVLLASDEASYISGAVIPVTGGETIL